MICRLFAIFAVHENKYFSQPNSRNTRDASKSDRQYCTAQKYFRHNNWRNTHDASKSNRQYCTAQNISVSIIRETLMTLQNLTGNTVPLKNISVSIIRETLLKLQIRQAILYRLKII